MTVFITGGVKNGKSTLAQKIAVCLSKGGKHYYIATMIPTDEEDVDRIRRHIAFREGMGFETIERGKDILSCLEQADTNGTFLLDSVTALLMNEMFPEDRGYEMDRDAVRRCEDGLTALAEKTANTVFVSDYIYGDIPSSDEVTLTYQKGMAQLDQALAQVCDVVIELAAGLAVIHKGHLLWPTICGV